MLSAIEEKMSPGVLIIIAILAVVFFLFSMLNLLVQNILRLRQSQRRRRRVEDDGVGGDIGSPTAFQGQLQQLFHLHDAGMDQTFIDALPIFVYRAVVGAGFNKDDPFDCAVCLCEFGMDDKLRLLPTCGHAFHVPCIDAWLLSHSTCPLCRGSILLAEDSTASSPIVRVLESENIPEMLGNGESESHGGRDSEKSHKAEEVVEVKLGKLMCIDGNGNAGEVAFQGSSSSNGDIIGSGNLGQRRCQSMGSYEYVMAEHTSLRVAIKTSTRRPASSRSQRRLALSECDFGGSKKGAWEAAVTEAASADAGRCGDGSATALATPRLNKDSFSVSKIWMVSAKKEDDRKPEFAAWRRTSSFRWPAMAEASKKNSGNEEHGDVETGSCGSNGDSSLAGERPSLSRTALQFIVGRRQHSRRVGNHC
ncbi:hypothetical protein GUJ93_ZPchr0006g43212 [Zizania palustris]|uniref:RING-type E3 ubiquitin transferase n=1 Tax=Zizania palustris TaxID=103762 RepID=A0A8J5SNW8_ZIZPA|nr:hypothetical protein GUJ93_ZPchr0006g43212 [Zizania palustris]